MARRSAGISGLAVLLGTTGIYLTWSGARGVSPVGGLRDLLQGRVPQGSTKPYTPVTLAAVVQGAEGLAAGIGLGGVIPESATRLVPGTSIRVDPSIVNKVALLVAAARTVGITLDGSGWRSTETQRQLRIDHGYTSDSQPSGSGGRTPVAIPGQSMHERGLAIDFTVNGKSITAGSTAHKWLVANASRYGLYPLASEPWHWSTTGR